MTDIQIRELKLPAFLIEKATMKKLITALKRSRFEARSIIVSNNQVVGGFYNYFKTNNEIFVQTTELNGGSGSLEIAMATLLNISKECLLLDDEHKVLEKAYKKVSDAAASYDISATPFPTFFPVHDIFIEQISQGSLGFMPVLEMVKLIKPKEQMQLFREWKGGDIGQRLSSWLNDGTIELEPYSPVESVLLSEEDVKGIDELSRIEDRIRKIDDAIKSSLFEKGRLLFRINEEKLYKLKGFTFKEYCLETFGLSGGYCFKILKMYRLTPNLMKDVGVSRLSWIHEHISDEHLIGLNRDKKLTSNIGEVSVDEMVHDTLSKVETKILPFARPSVLKRVQSRGQRKSVGQIKQYLKLIKTQLIGMGDKDRNDAMILLIESISDLQRSYYVAKVS